MNSALLGHFLLLSLNSSDLWLSFNDIDKDILEELENIYKTEIDIPHKGGKELGIALDDAMEMAITLLVENEDEDRELLDIDNHIARMIARDD
jgi:hypothetical protein